MGPPMIQDILSSSIAVAGQMDFVAAAAPPLDVAVTVPGMNGIDCHDANGNLWIEPGDNLLLQRVWCSIPFGFVQGSEETHLGIVFRNNAGASSIITEFAGNSAFTFPDICHGIDFPGSGLFIANPNGGVRWKWNLTAALAMRVSMVNLPSVLIGTTVKVQFHFMVAHTKALQAAP